MVAPLVPDNTTLGVKIVSAGVAGCIADVVTFPLDVFKVRLQIQGEAGSTLLYRGIFPTLATMFRQEGVLSWYNGLCAGLQRQMCFASVRIGFYDNVKGFYAEALSSSTTDVALGICILAGLTTGGMSVVIAQPTDVVKVRMQAQRGAVKRYTGALHAYRTIAKQEGIPGLWKGTLPNMVRNGVVNAAELVCYDLVKQFLLKRQLVSDNLLCHFLSAMPAGFCATLVASPVDVVKTRFMNSPPGQYKGALECAFKMWREGGLLTFYKGFMPSWVRLGSWNVCMFLTFEQLKRRFSHISDNGLTPYPGPDHRRQMV